ncbi:cytochrome c biogenesis CcdA family protein [Nocardioides yefusunii]|uniref:Cytochrome c biogenesis CcdA family protein n=1 Tax=Nocardioides yefusunii TaxID=2500546 RepID=A0ABW1QXM2_9ACTN|nr:cytochrome c biogenesis CcdA family protein [Nocardioides yefusunii]
MGETFQQIAASGSLLPAIAVATIAGLLSFFSPCVIPLIPGYMSYATGISAADLNNPDAPRRTGRMLLGSTLFVLGFTVVFVTVGVLSGAAGNFLAEHSRPITVVLGLLVILLGLSFAGWLPFLQRDWRIHKVPAVGIAAAPMLGFLFGLGWTPCLGPTLAVIFNLGFNEGTAARGALLAVFYCLGLGVPFVLAGLAYHRMLGAFFFFRRHQVALMRIGGAMMVIVGVLLVSGLWNDFTTWFQTSLNSEFEVGV